MGPDGGVWFPESATGVIWRVDPLVLRGTGVVAVEHSGAAITAIVLEFDETLDPRTAREPVSYHLAAARLKRHSVASWKGVRIAGVSYHRSTNTVRLKLARPRKGPLEVMVRIGILSAEGGPGFSDFTAAVS